MQIRRSSPFLFRSSIEDLGSLCSRISEHIIRSIFHEILKTCWGNFSDIRALEINKQPVHLYFYTTVRFEQIHLHNFPSTMLTLFNDDHSNTIAGYTHHSLTKSRKVRQKVLREFFACAAITKKKIGSLSKLLKNEETTPKELVFPIGV